MPRKTKKPRRREKSTEGTVPNLREEIRSLVDLWGLNEPDNAKSKDTRPPRARRDVLQDLEPETPKAKPRKVKKVRPTASASSPSSPPPTLGKGLPRGSEIILEAAWKPVNRRRLLKMIMKTLKRIMADGFAVAPAHMQPEHVNKSIDKLVTTGALTRLGGTHDDPVYVTVVGDREGPFTFRWFPNLMTNAEIDESLERVLRGPIYIKWGAIRRAIAARTSRVEGQFIKVQQKGKVDRVGTQHNFAYKWRDVADPSRPTIRPRKRPEAFDAENIDETTAAGWLKVSPDEMRNMRLLKTGPQFTNVRGRIRYKTSDIQKWLQERKK